MDRETDPERIPMTQCRLLAVQKKTYSTPRENLEAVRDILARMTSECADRGILGDGLSENRNQTDGEQLPKTPPDFILLPEIFTCPYDNRCFPAYAQEDGGEVFQFLSNLARDHQCYLIGGSVPEVDEQGKIYNTSYVFDRGGDLIGKHRKVHLFDIDVPGGQYFKESDVLTAGDSVTVFDTEFGKVGVCICFDIRFPDLFLTMREMGVRMVFVPAAFNMTTGPAHWETLFRSRALDQQIFLLGCSPARDTEASYVAYGHSILTDPWGRVINELDEKEGLLSEVIDLDLVDAVRQQIPLRKV